MKPPALALLKKSPRTLIIVVASTVERSDPQDFVAIGNRVAAMDLGISVYIAPSNVNASTLPEEIWKHPTLTVSFSRNGFTPLRGRILHNRQVPKLEQAQILDSVGVSVPHCETFIPGMDLSSSVWSQLLLLKPRPLELTSHGDNIQIFKRSTLAQMTKADFPPSHATHRMPMILQNFVDTGVHPCKYRVLTLCGEVLYAQFRTLKEPRPDLHSDDATLLTAQVATSGGDCEYVHDDYPDVVAFAKRASAAFPTIPLLGIDIVRDKLTGDLHVLEVNAGGNVWHFSSRLWAGRRKLNPEIMAAALQQFGAFEVAAQALASATLKLAT
jgi:hypothetical protein